MALNVTFNNRYGFVETATNKRQLKKCINFLLNSLGSEEFLRADEEHADVYISRGDEALTVCVSGMIVASKTIEGDDYEYLYGVPFTELEDLMYAYAINDAEALAEYDWTTDKTALTVSPYPLYLHASDETMTPLHRAASRGDVSWVQTAIDDGVDINSTDSEGNTPLHIAVLAEKPGVCKLLVENGADVNATDDNGDTIFDHLDLGLEWDYDGKIAKQIRKIVGDGKR